MWARELFLSFNQEIQSFYLSPPNSSPYFAKSELVSKGGFEIFKALEFKVDFSASQTVMKNQNQKSFSFNPVQLGPKWTFENFDFFIGGFQIKGEGTDLNNIFDVVNAQDFRQPFNSSSIGSVGLLLNSQIDNVSVKGFYIPKNNKSLLPGTDSAWWPRTEAVPIRNSFGTFLFPSDINYTIVNEAEERNAFKDNFGFTTKYSFAALDLSLFYYSGANQAPKISPNFNLDTISLDPLIAVFQSPIELNLNWFRSEHTGGGLTLVLGDWISRIFYKQQIDMLPQNEKSTALTASLENSFAVSRFSLRYFLQTNRIWRPSSSVAELETLLGFFEKSFALGTYLDLNSAGLLSGAVIYNEKDPAYLISVGYEYRWTEQFKTKLNTNILAVSGDNPIAKAYDKTDNLSLVLGYDF
jgi:hypothetical protein